VKEKIIFSWSGGKDSALGLYKILQSPRYEVSALLVTITEDYQRISMHGVRRTLLTEQADALGLPLVEVPIPRNASNEVYENNMQRILSELQNDGVSAVAFGDIFLEDLRQYREKNLAQIGLKGIFPLWRGGTRSLALELIELGFKAITTCVDTSVLGKEFVGRLFDKAFLHQLPAGIDCCGENGEFHSFVFEGPIFQKRIKIRKGKVVLRDQRFLFCDLLPAEKSKAEKEG
jgi:uncharacterized protein (TIGR00290 family)